MLRDRGMANMLAQPLQCEPPKEGVEGQLVLGSYVKLWVPMMGIQLHICGEGAEALCSGR